MRTCTTDETRRSDYVAYLAETAVEFVSLPQDIDIHKRIAARLQTFLGPSVVAVGSFHAETQSIRCRAVVGLGTLVDQIDAMLGNPLLDHDRYPPPEFLREICHSRIHHLEGGVHDIFFGRVPHPICDAITRMLRIRDVYGLSCVVADQPVGIIMVLLRAGAVLPPMDLLEAFVNMAGVLIQRQRAEQALRASEARYRMLVQQSAEVIIQTDAERRIVSANPAACLTLGAELHDLLGMHIEALLDGDEQDHKPLPWNELKAGHPIRDVRRVKRRDGTSVISDAVLSPLPDGGLLVNARDVTERRRLEQEVLQVSERERRAVGHTLHDSLGQQLAGAALLSDALQRDLRRQGLAEADQAERVSELLRDSVRQARDLAKGLNPVDLKAAGLNLALGELAVQTRQSFDLTCRAEIDDDLYVRDDALANHLYLIAREAVSNAVRHAGASEIRIILRSTGRHGCLDVVDNGRGMRPEADAGEGMGFGIMRYRSELINAVFRIESGRSGTTVRVVFPVGPGGKAAS